MKRNLLVTIILLLTISTDIKSAQEESIKDEIRLCSYNIRGDLPNDGINSWKYRKDSLCKIIRQHDFDIICMQEVLANQLEDIEKDIHYEFVGIRGLYNPIFYKAERFESLHNEVFWLSETMSLFSKGWDGMYDRYCVWAKFRDRKNGKIFYVFNTHLDHKGKIAQRKGAQLVCDQAKKYAGESALFICGDMNSLDTTDAYKTYTKHYKDSRKIAKEVNGVLGTAHNFGQVRPVRIDYIFVNEKVSVSNYNVDNTCYPNGLYPSDHFPVFIDAQIVQ